MCLPIACVCVCVCVLLYDNQVGALPYDQLATSDALYHSAYDTPRRQDVVDINMSVADYATRAINMLWLEVFTRHMRDVRRCAVAQLVEEVRCKPEGRVFDSQWSRWNFSVTQSFRLHCDLGVDSACNRNEYQESLLGVKTAGAYHLHVLIV